MPFFYIDDFLLSINNFQIMKLGNKIYIRGDFWKTCHSFKQPKRYVGEVVSNKSRSNKFTGEIEWPVELEGYEDRIYWIPEEQFQVLYQFRVLDIHFHRYK